MLESNRKRRFRLLPVHPQLAHLPIGFWVASFIFDVLFLATGKPAIASAAYHTMMFGLLGAALAIPAGLNDYLVFSSRSSPKRIATGHMCLNLFITLLYLLNFFAREGLENGVPSLVTRGELLLSFFSLLLLGFAGYLGTVLVFNSGRGYRTRPQPDFEPSISDAHSAQEPRRRRIA